MRKFLIALCLAVAGLVSMPAAAQLSFGFSSGGVRLGINVPVYPRLVPVPGYPVYWAPDVNANYFFYDGMYWLFYDDNWYGSQWYNGPWYAVPPDEVPLFVLRVPVRYYHHRPAYFRGWALNDAPRWDQLGGRAWSDPPGDSPRWHLNRAPARAPLPNYQRNYSGNRYPNVERQRTEQARNYRYQPRDEGVRRHWEGQRGEGAAAPQAQPQRREERRGQGPQAREERRGQAPQAREERRGQAPQAREERRGQAPQAREERRGGSSGPGSGPGGSPTQKDAERWGSGG
jgi:hypothetical protein